MSRGDQRERDREKNRAKLAQKNRQNSSGGDPSGRNLDDKSKLLAKIEAKNALKAQQALEEEQNAGKPLLKAKPKKKVADTSLDLLSVGLSSGKKKAPKK